MADKIKVAHVIRVFSYGGAEVLLREFFSSKAFKENVVSDLFILDHIKLGLVEQVRPDIRDIYSYKIATIFFLPQCIKFFRDLYKGNYDIVHMHLPVAGWMGIVLNFFVEERNSFIQNITLLPSIQNTIIF